MTEKIAILGANGQMGRAVIEYFVERGSNLECCDKIGGAAGTQRIDKVDLKKTGSIGRWLGKKRVSTIVHLASEIPSPTKDDDMKLLEANLRMHQEVFHYWQEKGCQLIFASGCNVYGTDGPIPWRESNEPNPEDLYSVSKLVGESLFKVNDADESPLTVLRINAPYGFPQKRKTVVNIFMERALAGEDIELFGSGKRMQDFLHVRDVASAFWLAKAKRMRGVFNIASGEVVTMKRLAELIVDCTHSRSKIVLSGKPDPKEEEKIGVDISRAKRELGFKPEYSLKEGLEKLVEEYERARK